MDRKAEIDRPATAKTRTPPVEEGVSDWKRLRYWLEWAALSTLASAVPLFPRKACVIMGRALGSIAFALDRRGRAVALGNLEAALGSHYSDHQRVAIARGSYQTFTRSMIDLFWSPRLSSANCHRYLRMEGFDRLQREHSASSGGSVFMCVHSGNFEWASLAYGFNRLRATIVAEEFKNPLLAGIFNRLREISGHRIIPQDRSVLRLLKVVKRGGVAGLLIDLNLRPTQPSVAIEAFGMKMCVTFLQAVLARRAGALLVPIESIPQEDGSCRIIAHEPLRFAAEASDQMIAQGCWNFFEPRIRAAPQLWMWSYKHWRYKPDDAARPYPFYANHSSAFEKLLRSD